VLLKYCGVDIVPPKVDEREVQRLHERDFRPKINGTPLGGGPLAVTPGGTIKVDPGSLGKAQDHGQVVAVFASDRQGLNIVDSPRMALESFRELETRVDGRKVSSTTIRFAGTMPPPLPSGPPVFVCWLNGKPVQVKQDETLCAVAGDQLVIEGVLGSKWKEVLNFKGFTSRPHDNDGQDMGAEIILDPESFIDKYRLPSPTQETARFQVARETSGARPASFYVDIEPRKVKSLKLVNTKGQTFTVNWASGGEILLPPGVYSVAETSSNGPTSRLLPLAGNRPLKPGDTFRVEPGKPMLFSLRQATTFAALGTMTLVPKATAPSAEAERQNQASQTAATSAQQGATRLSGSPTLPRHTY